MCAKGEVIKTPPCYNPDKKQPAVKELRVKPGSPVENEHYSSITSESAD